MVSKPSVSCETSLKKSKKHHAGAHQNAQVPIFTTNLHDLEFSSFCRLSPTQPSEIRRVARGARRRLLLRAGARVLPPELTRPVQVHREQAHVRRVRELAQELVQLLLVRELHVLDGASRVPDRVRGRRPRRRRRGRREGEEEREEDAEEDDVEEWEEAEGDEEEWEDEESEEEAYDEEYKEEAV